MRPVLITGGNGTLGAAFERMAWLRGLAPVATRRDQLDIADPLSVRRAIARHDPWAVVNAAGHVRVDDAEHDRTPCWRENVVGPALLASACAAADIPLVVFSSDLVFDGSKPAAYDEDDPPAPLGVYGRSKVEAEQEVARRHPAALIVRTSAFFGPWDAHNFVTTTLAALRQGRAIKAAECIVSPTYVPDLVDATFDLLVDGERGLWHLANSGPTSWVDLGRRVARDAGFDPALVTAADPAALGWRAARPSQSVLCSRRGQLLPSLDSAIGRFLAAWRSS